MRRLVLPALLLILVRVDAGASARQDLDKIRSAKRVEAVRVDQPIRLDGVLDEPVWERATPATDFYQQQPAEFELATRKTEVRFLFDDDTLYVGAVLYDPEPHRLINNELKRDSAKLAHRLFAGGGRRAADQPHPLQPVFFRRSASSFSKALRRFRSDWSKTTMRTHAGILCRSSAGALVCRRTGGPFRSSPASF
jgi:Carbohydrate family 9 binding domain-like